MLGVPSSIIRASLRTYSLNYCSPNGGNSYRAPYYTGNPNIGPRIIGNLDQPPYIHPFKVWADEVFNIAGTHYRIITGCEHSKTLP